MKKRLVKSCRWLFPMIILFLFSLNALCQNDKPTEDDRKAYYQFWQQADLYILEQIQIKFNDSLTDKLKNDLKNKITELKDDNLLYFKYNEATSANFISKKANQHDYLDNISVQVNQSKLRGMISSTIAIKKIYRGEIVTDTSRKLFEQLDKFKKDVDDEIDKYVNSNTNKAGNDKKKSDTEQVNTKSKKEEDTDTAKKAVQSGNAKKPIKQENPKKEKDEINTTTTELQSNFYFKILLLVLFVSVGCLFFLFFIFRRNINNRFDQLNGELLALKSAFSRQLDAKDEEWRRRNNELQNSISNRLNDTKRDLDDLYQHVQQYQVQNQFQRMPDRQSVGTPLAPPPPAQNYKTYYLPSPDPQGFFWNDKKTTVPDGGTFYELKVEDDNPNIGQLSFYTKSEKNVKTALSNPDMYIKPVCRSSDGIYSGSSIEVKSPGKLQFMGEKWILANGAKVTIIVV